MSTITVRVAKLGTEVDFTPEQLPAESIKYLLTYGATQSVNDAAASIIRKNFESDETFAAAVREKVDARIDQIRTGNVPGSRVVDPNSALARKVAKLAAADPATMAKLEALLAEAA
jgi:hypothetical protein